jgi:DNA-binding response OmpR family regulator
MKRVLLAEDEPNIVTPLKFLLVRAGFVVQAEDNGRNALAIILASPPDLLILDVMLPEIDGLEILRQARADERTKSVPVIMLTAKGAAETQASAKAAGDDVFITQPFANTDVIEAAVQLTEPS